VKLVCSSYKWSPPECVALATVSSTSVSPNAHRFDSSLATGEPRSGANGHPAEIMLQGLTQRRLTIDTMDQCRPQRTVSAASSASRATLGQS